MKEIRLFPTLALTATAAADAFVLKLKQLLSEKDSIHVSITGGTLGIATLSAIAEHQDVHNLDWSKVNIWWGDERFTNRASSDRNFNQAFDALLSIIPTAKLHPMPSSDNLGLLEATSAFRTTIAEFAPDGFIPFDLTLLGMGPDGHIASLFPGKPVPELGLNVVAEADSPKPPAQRISFTYEAINKSQEIWFLVAGSDKAEPVALANSVNADSIPAGRVHGTKKTIWFLDEAAAQKLR